MQNFPIFTNDNEFLIDNTSILTPISTRLTAKVNQGGTTLNVQNTSGLSQDDYLLIESLGAEKAEIVRINASVSSSTSVSVTSTSFKHSGETIVRRVLYDKIEISGGSSPGANVVATIDIQPGSDQSYYVNTGTTYDNYYIRYKDSNTGTFSSYSDAVNETNKEETVGFIVDTALNKMGKKLGHDKTAEDMLEEINTGLSKINERLKRWDYLQTYDHVLGQTQLGKNTYTLPNDIENQYSGKSILDLVIQDQSSLNWKGKREFNEELQKVAKTTIRNSASKGDTTLDLDNSYDFDDSGSVTVWKNGTEISIDYTDIVYDDSDGGTAQLKGIPSSGNGSITESLSSGLNVWQGEDRGQPRYYTVYEGKLRIWPLPSSTYNNKNLKLDYYSKTVTVDSLGDKLEDPRNKMIRNWLLWKLKGDNSVDNKLDPEDAHKIMFDKQLARLVQNLDTGQDFKSKPKINRINL